MSKYPYLLFNDSVTHKPIFKGLKGEPFILDLSLKSDHLVGIGPRDQVKFQQHIEQLMHPSYQWGVASYLENRQSLLSECPQMVAEQRFFHLGLDIIVKVGTPLYAPLDAVVYESDYEAGEGNYGGYVLLQHNSHFFETFYSLYGHLSKKSLPVKGQHIKVGEPFAEIGDFHENGNWFHHTHLQIITEKGLEEGFISKGYCSKKALEFMEGVCPPPLPLFITK